MKDWTSSPERDPMHWLLESENPSVRYRALSGLLGKTQDDPAVRAARVAVSGSSLVQRIRAQQDPVGFWGDPATPYHPKYRATYWTLMVLGHLGVSGQDEWVARSVDHVFRFQRPEGGFAEYGTEGARREYAKRVQWCRVRGREPPKQAAFIADRIHQMTLSCLTGNVVSGLLRLGYVENSRLWRAVDWLVGIQNADGGWLCPYWKAHVRDTHSCFHGTICALEAFAEIPQQERPPAVQDAAARGCQFLLRHRLYRADHHDFRVINASWLRLAFPWFYGYSVLRGLWVLTRLGFRDERMDDALAVLRQQRTPEGRWLLESTPYGRMQVNLEKRGRESKWITLHAMWVLQDWSR